MWKIATLLVLTAGVTSGYITCPDGRHCPDGTTCCQNKAATGYNCCPTTNAVCCADKVHCCPHGTFCNARTLKCDTLDQPWRVIPMLKKVPAEEPSPLGLLLSASLLAAESKEDDGPAKNQQLAMMEMSQAAVEGEESGEKRGTLVPCDSKNFCSDGYSCCRSTRGGWWCCPYSPSMCCLDGAHCCPYGYYCDLTFKACLKQGLRYPFTSKLPASIPAFQISVAGEGNQQED